MPDIIEANVVINRPVETVFDCVADVDSASRWQAELVEVKDVLSRPIGTGTTMTVVLAFLGRHIENVMRVADYAPNSKFSLTYVSGPLPTEVQFTFEPVHSGSTRVTYRGTWELPAGTIFRLLTPIKPIFDRMDRRQWQANLDTLKKLLEAL